MVGAPRSASFMPLECVSGPCVLKSQGAPSYDSSSGLKTAKENSNESVTPKSASTSTESSVVSKSASTKTITFCSTAKISKERLAEIVAMVNFAGKINTMGIDDFKRLFHEIQVRGPCPHELTKHAHELNTKKCRYHDIVCLDDSRVVLKPMPKFTGDFIHASWISHKFLEKKFICTQGPMENTVADFWRMIWQEHVELIIMLCELCEEGSEKCAPYWPTKNGESKHFNGIIISNIDMQCREDVFLTVFSVTYGEETRRLRHFQWKGWPDRFAPRHLITPYTLHGISHTVKWPTVVHCSAGIGRSGTFVMLECLRAGKERSVPSLLWDLRSQRAGAVQTFDQFLFIYYATIQRLINRGVVDPVTVTKFCKEYEARFKRKTGKVPIEWPMPTRRIIIDPALLDRAKALQAKRRKKTVHRLAKDAKKRSKQNSQPLSRSKVGSETSKSASIRGFTENLHPGNSKDAQEKLRKSNGSEAENASLTTPPTSQFRNAENHVVKSDHRVAPTKPSKAMPSIKPKFLMTSKSAEASETVGSDDALLEMASGASEASRSKEDIQPWKDDADTHDIKGSKEEDMHSFKESVQPFADESLSSKEDLRSPKEPHPSQRVLQSRKMGTKSPVGSEIDKADKLKTAHIVKSSSFLDEFKNLPTGSGCKPSFDELKDKTSGLDQPSNARSPLIEFFCGAHACDSDFVKQDMARFNVKSPLKKQVEDSSKKEHENAAKQCIVGHAKRKNCMWQLREDEVKETHSEHKGEKARARRTNEL
uniref:Protein-tyrosine-phosphatase n=1 Tax=Ascaris lumbricoides TaxID=6252 RepID=A0A0M3HN23_ASCLU